MKPLRYVLLGALFLLIMGALFFAPKSSPKAPSAVLGGTSLRLLVATTTAAMEKGLGRRDSLPADEGMLFVFPKPDRYGFWMKDMRFPIDIIWLDAQGHVITVAGSVATSSYPGVFYPSAPATYVLETNAGFAASHNIATSTLVKLQNVPDISE